MAAARFLAVKKFEQYQHYRDRGPVWIKLYNRLLDDYGFLELPDAARSHLMLIWLLASRHDNRIPYDAKWLARAIHATGRLDIERLIQGGWLIVVEQDASNGASAPLAEPEQDARDTLAHPERNGTAPRALAERERQRERERERQREKLTTTTASPARARDADLVRGELPEPYRADLDAALTASGRPLALVAELQALHDDTHGTGRRYSWPEIGLGLHDLVANGKHNPFNVRQLRRYVEGARAQLPADSGPDLDDSGWMTPEFERATRPPTHPTL